MFYRILKPILSYSFFIFGPRGTGKTTFLKNLFSKEEALYLDLLDPVLDDELQRNPNNLISRIDAKGPNLKWIIIDEVQKNVKLLNIVHHLIEERSLNFALTGSSARKLKKGSANLLAGRAFVNYMFPLTSVEMKDQFDLNEAINWGGLPAISNMSTIQEKSEYLRSYALTYLKEEIWAEHIIRNLDPFRRFLEIAAQCNSEPMNYSNISKDVGVDIKTIQSYFEILVDTLLGFFLEPYHESIRKQQRQSPKFYFFDTGVKRALQHVLTQELVPKTYGYGKAFEHFIISEIYRLNHYFFMDLKLYYLLTKDHAEIDLIVEYPNKKTLLIEIKSSEYVDERDASIINRFLPDFKNAEGLIISRDNVEKNINGIYLLPWEKALKKIMLWTKEGLMTKLDENGFYKDEPSMSYCHSDRKIIITNEIIQHPKSVDYSKINLNLKNIVYSLDKSINTNKIGQNTFKDAQLEFENIVVAIEE